MPCLSWSLLKAFVHIRDPSSLNLQRHSPAPDLLLSPVPVIPLLHSSRSPRDPFILLPPVHRFIEQFRENKRQIDKNGWRLGVERLTCQRSSLLCRPPRYRCLAGVNAASVSPARQNWRRSAAIGISRAAFPPTGLLTAHRCLFLIILHSDTWWHRLITCWGDSSPVLCS